MKRKLQIIISASAASVMAFSALAQDTPTPKLVRPDYNRDGRRNPDGQVIRDGQPNTDRAPNNVSTRKADGTWAKDRISGDSQTMIPASRLGQVQKAFCLDLDDENLGQSSEAL